MCGRIVLTHKVEEIYKRYDVTVPDSSWDIPLEEDNKLYSSDNIKPSYNIAPGMNLLCAFIKDGVHDIRYMKWGLVPFWSKDLNMGYKTFNARSETIHRKPTFRSAFRKQRCLIPITGFYEWKRSEDRKTKQPYFFKHKDDEILSLAGIWERWNGDGETNLFTCSIVTTTPNDLMSPIHDRMPVILSREDEYLWLSNESDKDSLKELMIPYKSDDLACYPVSTLCNSTKIDVPECIEEIPEPIL